MEILKKVVRKYRIKKAMPEFFEIKKRKREVEGSVKYADQCYPMT